MKRVTTTMSAICAALALGAVSGMPAHAADASHTRSFAKDRASIRAHLADDVKPYGTCSLTVPNAVRIVRTGTAIPVRLTGGCTLRTDFLAGWYVGDYEDPADYIFFGQTTTGAWQAFAFTPLGVRTWMPDGAVDEDDHSYLQNSPRTTVKVGSWAGAWTSRVGAKVTVNTQIVRYSTAYDVTFPWASKTGIIQYRPTGARSWTNLKQVTTNSSGTASYTYTSSAKRDYRVVYGEATYVWGATSPTVTR